MAKKVSVFVSVVITILVGCGCANAQQNGNGNVALLHQAFAAIAQGNSIQDMTLTGSVRTIAGATDETGTFTIKAAPGGFSRIEFNLPSQNRVETSSVTDLGTAKGSWKVQNDSSHNVPSANLMAAPDWFFPAFTLRRILSPTYVVTYVGVETRNGISVAHFSAYKSMQGVKPASAASALERASQIEIFLDSSTLFPSAICFNTHPDGNGSMDIPVEVRFSGYQRVNGALVPHHIEKYVNETLTTDIQVQSADFNTGMTASSFDAQ